MTSIAMYSIIFHLTNRRVGTVNCCQLNFSSLLYNIQQLPSQNQLFFPYFKTITFQQCGVYFRQTCTMIESGSATLHYGEKCENLKHISMYCETCELKKYKIVSTVGTLRLFIQPFILAFFHNILTCRKK